MKAKNTKLSICATAIVVVLAILVLTSSCQTGGVNASGDFEHRFLSYIEASDNTFSNCELQQCRESLPYPVYKVDSSANLVYWNLAATSLAMPTSDSPIYMKDGTTYLMRKKSHWIYLIPLVHADARKQKEWLASTFGRYYEHTKYTYEISSSGEIDVTSVVVHPSLDTRYLIGYFLVVSLLLLLIIHQSKRLLDLFGDWPGSIVTILLLIFARLCLGAPYITTAFAAQTIFQHHLSGWVFSTSLGELFLNMLLFFVITIFLFRTFDNRPIRIFTGGRRWLILISGYLLVISSIISFVYVVKQVVIGSSIDFQFDKIYVLDANTHIFIISVLLFICSLFLISYLLIKILAKTGTRFMERLISFIVAASISIPVFLQAELNVSTLGFYILVLSILSLMDLFVESKQKSISWLVLWLITISSGTTALLYSHNTIAYYNKAEQFAKTIPSNQDEKTSTSDRTSAFDWAKFESWQITKQIGQPPLHLINENLIPSIGNTSRLSDKHHQALLYRHDPGTFTLVSRARDQIIQFISLFSFLFTSLVLVVVLVFAIHSLFPFIPNTWNIRFHRRRSIRRRIQYVIFSVLVISFATVFAVTSFYMQDLQHHSSDKLTSEQHQSIQFIQSYLNQLPADSHLVSLTSLPIISMPYTIYSMNGQRIAPVLANQAHTPYAPYEMTGYADNRLAIRTLQIGDRTHAYQQALLQDTPYIVGVSTSNVSTDENYLINNLLGTLLNLYIFLFVIASSLALAFSDTITRPLFKLREKFSSVKIGRSNEPIDYDSDDEVGELIKDYNRMLTKIEESVNTLAMTERELAWREMAKQVAHEIKNPLTPMKLSLQHLQFAIKRDPDRAEELIDRVGKTLLEQIENLSRIASEFSNFAKMPKPENKQVVLNDIASSVHDLFRKRSDMDINLYIPIDEIYVFGDPHYMTRVLINLLKNATQAIPPQRRGLIDIHVYKEDENAIIKVTDNGTGIPVKIRDKVFQPNFTSKSSGTGLGLAICANIIESFNGKIYFETEVNVGTTFFIEIPLMHKEENFKKEKHVIL